MVNFPAPLRYNFPQLYDGGILSVVHLRRHHSETRVLDGQVSIKRFKLVCLNTLWSTCGSLTDYLYLFRVNIGVLCFMNTLKREMVKQLFN